MLFLKHIIRLTSSLLTFSTLLVSCVTCSPLCWCYLTEAASETACFDYLTCEFQIASCNRVIRLLLCVVVSLWESQELPLKDFNIQIGLRDELTCDRFVRELLMNKHFVKLPLPTTCAMWKETLGFEEDTFYGIGVLFIILVIRINWFWRSRDKIERLWEWFSSAICVPINVQCYFYTLNRFIFSDSLIVVVSAAATPSLDNLQDRHIFQFACFSPLARYRNMGRNPSSKRISSSELVSDSHRSVRRSAKLLELISHLQDILGLLETLRAVLGHFSPLVCCSHQPGCHLLAQSDSGEKLLKLLRDLMKYC